MTREQLEAAASTAAQNLLESLPKELLALIDADSEDGQEILGNLFNDVEEAILDTFLPHLKA